MIGESTIKNKLPTNMAWFIIASSIPQILGINNSLIDTAFKLLVMGVFALVAIKGKDVSNVSMFSVGFMAFTIIRNIITIAVNRVGIVSGFVEIFTTLILFYLFFEITRSTKAVTVDDVMGFYKVYAYFIIISCVYNMIVNFGSLTNIFSAVVYSGKGVCSFFDNKNTFGFYLLMGSLATMFLYSRTKEKRWFFTSLLFIVNELMAMCRTAMLLSLVVLLMSIIVGGRKTGRRILVAICLVVAGFIVIKNVPFLDRYFFGSVLGDTDSLEVRETFVENMLPLARGKQLWIGYGGDLSRTLALSYTGNIYFHNTYLYLLISGGLFQVVLFLSCIITAIKSSVVSYRKDMGIGAMCLISIVIYLVYAYIESVPLFNTKVVSMISTIFAVSMPLLLKNAINYETEF